MDRKKVHVIKRVNRLFQIHLALAIIMSVSLIKKSMLVSFARLSLLPLIFLGLFLMTQSTAATAILDASAALERGDYQAALNIYRPLAEQGDPEAQLGLGYLYYKGYGVAQDYQQAMHWYRRSSDQGNVSALYVALPEYQTAQSRSAARADRIGKTSCELALAQRHCWRRLRQCIDRCGQPP